MHKSSTVRGSVQVFGDSYKKCSGIRAIYHLWFTWFTCKISRRSASEPQKGDLISSSIPSVIQTQREAFSGLSMRNRGISEASPTRSPITYDRLTWGFLRLPCDP